jgi:topoisomerase IA-like protein
MISPTTPSAGGSSKIELDTRLLNSLLAIFVNKPGGLQVQVAEQGHLHVQQGDLQVGVDPFTLAQGLRVQLRNGNLGPFFVQLNQLQLGAQGLTLSLQLQT